MFNENKMSNFQCFLGNECIKKFENKKIEKNRKQSLKNVKLSVKYRKRDIYTKTIIEIINHLHVIARTETNNIFILSIWY